MALRHPPFFVFKISGAAPTGWLPGRFGKAVGSGLLHAHFHEDFQADAKHAGRERIPSHNFREVFAIERHGILGIRQRQKKAHADLVHRLAGLEINAAARNAKGSAHIVEVLLLWIGRADAHKLCDFAAATAAAFGSCWFRSASATCGGCLSHDALLGLHESLASRCRDGSRESVRLAQHKTYRGNVPPNE